MLPIHIDIGFLHLHNYEGIYFFIAILAALIYITFLFKQDNIDLEPMYEGTFISLIVALLLGRFFSLLFWYTDTFLANPLIFFQMWKGGITVSGGVLGGLTSGYIYARIKKLHFFYHIQYFIAPILLAQIIGRFGCFLNGDAAGIPTTAPWGMIFSSNSVAYTYTNYVINTPLHPTQLYEILGNVILFLFIVLTGKNSWITNRRIIWYALGYSTVRFIVEFFRNDPERWGILPMFTTGQLICIIGWIIGISALIWSLFNKEKMIADEKNIARKKAEKKA